MLTGFSGNKRHKIGDYFRLNNNGSSENLDLAAAAGASLVKIDDGISVRVVCVCVDLVNLGRLVVAVVSE